jgi:hypothetical protein
MFGVFSSLAQAAPIRTNAAIGNTDKISWQLVRQD